MLKFISLENVLPRIPESPFGTPINWDIAANEVWSILGSNGSGKSLLSAVICGEIPVQSGKIKYHFTESNSDNNQFFYPSEYIKKIDFNTAYSLLDYQKLFYQQRFDHSAYDEIPYVKEIFLVENIPTHFKTVFQNFGLFELLERKFIQLSSGELRKLLIAKALIDNPKMLIFDNPFIGLDEYSRKLLDELFEHLIGELDVQLLFLAPTLADIPACTTHILKMKSCTVEFAIEKSQIKPENLHPAFTFPKINWTDFNLENRNSSSGELVSMINMDISYGDQIIQEDVNWTISKNENWALLGPNGSGKSTLLSYIFADNLQAYTKNIRLFGQKRGTGESIWDIKRRIGFSSSELNLYYRKNVTCLSVVASGFFDSIGLYRTCDKQQIALAEKLLGVLHLYHLRNKSFLKVSSGEQRLLLFGRAIIKNPELLILDEPFHGLDDFNKKMCLSIVESFASQDGKSLVFVTHQKAEIPKCVDHFMVLNR